MKAPYRILLACAAFAAVSLGNANSQEGADKPKKPQRPPAEKTKAEKTKAVEPGKPKAEASSPKSESKKPVKKADAPKKPEPKASKTESKPVPPEKKAETPKKPAGQPQAGKGPQRPGLGNFDSDKMTKMREQLRGSYEEIQKLRNAGKDDEAEKKMAEFRKKLEGIREEFGGRGGSFSFGQRGPGQGKGGPPSTGGRGPGPGKPSGPPAAGKGPARSGLGSLDSDAAAKVREQMRTSFEEIQKLRQAGKDDEVEKKMAEVRKKFEAIREKIGGRGGPFSLGQRGPGQGKGGPPRADGRPDRDSRGDAKKPDSPKPPARPSPESHKQAAAKPGERKGSPHHHGDRDSRPEHRGPGGPQHHRGHESRGDGDDKSKYAESRSRHDRGPGNWAHGKPPFMMGRGGAFHRGQGGSQMMMHRMMMMKRMEMMAQARAKFSRGPGNWGQQPRAPFMQMRQWGAQPKVRMMQAKRAAAAKAGGPGRGDGKKAKKAGRAKGGKCEDCKTLKRAGKKEGRRDAGKKCEKCQESEKDS